LHNFLSKFRSSRLTTATTSTTSCSSPPRIALSARERLQVATNCREHTGDREHRATAGKPLPHHGDPLSCVSHVASDVAACSSYLVDGVRPNLVAFCPPVSHRRLHHQAEAPTLSMRTSHALGVGRCCGPRGQGHWSLSGLSPLSP
jgi:hypothetical protein